MSSSSTALPHELRPTYHKSDVIAAESLDGLLNLERPKPVKENVAPVQAPDCVLAALWVQSAWRRFKSLKDPMVINGMIAAWPSPTVQRAMYFHRRRRNPKMVSLDREAQDVISYVQLLCPNMKTIATLKTQYENVKDDHEINMFITDAIHIHTVNSQEIFSEEIKKREAKGATMVSLKNYLDGLMAQIPDEKQYTSKFKFLYDRLDMLAEQRLLEVLKKNFLKKIFGYEARCEF